MFNELNSGKWWDRALTLNVGCTEVSEECAGCWEREVAMQQTNVHGTASNYFGLLSNGKWTGQVRETPVNLTLPSPGQIPKCWSVWTDLFHPGVTLSLQFAAFRLFLTCANHIFVVCTKRPEIAAERVTTIRNQLLQEVIQQSCLPEISNLHENILNNVIIMTTAGTQANYDSRMPHLLNVPLKHKAVSVEPMLEAISLRLDQPASIYGLKGHREMVSEHLCWIITGGETENRLYHTARPSNPHWFESIRLQCSLYKVPFWHKHNGTYSYNEKAGTYTKVGHAKAGRFLFGKTYNELPLRVVSSLRINQVAPKK